MKKILVNVNYGIFEVKDNLFQDFMTRTQGLTDIREDEILTTLVEQGEEIGGKYSNIGYVEIPDNATDYYISNYDGKETVLYVVNGKIHITTSRFRGREY